MDSNTIRGEEFKFTSLGDTEGQMDVDDSPGPPPHSSEQLNTHPCTVGKMFRTKCHVSGKVGYKVLGDLIEENRKDILWKINCLDETHNMCNYHLGILSHVKYQKNSPLCKGYCNKSHKRGAKSKPLAVETFFKNLEGNAFEIYPGTPICRWCLETAMDQQNVEVDPDEGDEEFLLKDKFAKLNQVFALLGLDPFTPSKLSIERQKKKLAEKLRSAVQACIRLIATDGIDLDESEVFLAEKELLENERSFLSVMGKLKDKYVRSDFRGRVQVLTVVPEKWTIEKTAEFFSTDTYKCPKSQENGSPAFEKRRSVKCSRAFNRLTFIHTLARNLM